MASEHPRLNVSIRAALVVILVWLVLHLLPISQLYSQSALLFVVFSLTIPLSIYAIWPRKVPTGFFTDAKAAMRISVVYGLIITVFAFVFYTFIDRTYFPEMHREIYLGQLNSTPEAEKVNLEQNIRSFFSVRNFTVLMLIGFTVLSAFYAVLFSALKRLFTRLK